MYNNNRNDTLNVVNLKDMKNFIIDMDGVLLDISYDNYDVEQLDKDTKLHIQKYKNAKLNV